MKAYLIEPVEETVEEVEHDNTLESIYKLIEARVFELVPLGNTGNVVYVDEEGLFKEDQEFFALKDFPQPLAGKGLVLAHDSEGKDIEPTVSIDEVWKLVRFLDADQVRPWADKFL